MHSALTGWLLQWSVGPTECAADKHTCTGVLVAVGITDVVNHVCARTDAMRLSSQDTGSFCLFRWSNFATQAAVATCPFACLDSVSMTAKCLHRLSLSSWVVLSSAVQSTSSQQSCTDLAQRDRRSKKTFAALLRCSVVLTSIRSCLPVLLSSFFGATQQ